MFEHFSYEKKLEMLIDKNNGLLTTKEAENEGIPRTYIAMFVQKNKLIPVDRGVYVRDLKSFDRDYYIQSRYTVTIFSHYTALCYHGLINDVLPVYYITVPESYNAKKLLDMDVKVFNVKKELYDLGLTTAFTKMGKEVRLYDRERSLCDLMRSRNRIGQKDSIKMFCQCTQNNNVDIERLKQYAEKLKILNVITPYLDALASGHGSANTPLTIPPAVQIIPLKNP